MPTNQTRHRIKLLAARLAVCKLPRSDGANIQLPQNGFFSLTKTANELSLVCEAADAPSATSQEAGWRALEVEGPLEFALTGVIAGLSATLAEAQIPVFVISTFDTDYILIKDNNLDQAISALSRAGHEITSET